MAILEKIRLEIKDERFINICNPFKEKSQDYICKNTFIFEKGNIYGIVCEHGGGGESISRFLSNEESLKQEKIYIDDVEAESSDIKKIGWYVGKTLYSQGIITKELSIRKALEYAIKRYKRYENVEDIIEEFHLTTDRLDYSLSRNCEWEMWRASLAIGYASNKTVYCFPWMNTLFFYDCMYNSSVFRFFNKLKSEGAVIILPTSRKENVCGFVDKVIQIENPRYKHVISDNSYFKQYF